MKRELKKNSQHYLLNTYGEIFLCILYFGGGIHQSQFIRWIGNGNTRSSKATRLIKACVDAGLLVKCDLHPRNKFLHITKTVYRYLGYPNGQYRAEPQKHLATALLIERFLRLGYAPDKMLERLDRTNARYGFAAGTLECYLLDNAAHELAQYGWNTSNIEHERALMEQIANREQGGYHHHMNLHNLARRRIYISEILFNKKTRTVTVHMDFYNIFDHDARQIAKMLIDTQYSIQTIFADCSNPHHKVNCIVSIFSHDKENQKMNDKVLRYIVKDPLYIVTPDQASKDFQFFGFDTKKTLFSNIDIRRVA